MRRRPTLVVGLVVALAWCASGLRGQEPEATRRLSRVPVPTGASGRVEDLYTGSYALLVGVSRYDTPAWASLGSISQELSDLKTALVELGFGVEELSNPTGNELRRGVEDFVGRHGYEPGARLLFFFAGHGYTLDQGRRGYFVPRDAPDPLANEAGFRRVALSMDVVATWARDLTARHALFAFDSCFSGTVFRTRDRLVPQPITALTAKKVREFMSAGDAGEPVPARSVFTPTFARALRGGADLNHDGFVTGTELGNWIQSEVITYGTRQTPQFGKLRDPEFDEGDLVFVVPSAPTFVSTGTPPAPRSGPDADLGRREELALWDAIKDTATAATLEDYLRRYPTGLFRMAAQDRLARLRASAGAAGSTGAPSPPATNAPAVPAPTPPKVPFTTDAGLLMAQIHPDRTAVFEEMVGKLKSGIARSSDGAMRQQAAGLRMYRASEPLNANTLYIVVADPVVRGAEYELFGTLARTMTPEELRLPETQEMWKRYTEAFAAGLNKVSLTPLAGSLPLSRQPSVVIAPIGTPKLTFTTDAGLLLLTIKPDQVSIFEEFAAKLHAGMATTSNSDLAKQASGWRVYRSNEPYGANALYVVLVDPVIKNAEYDLFQMLVKTMTSQELQSPDAPAMWKRFQDAFASGINKLGLTPILVGGR